MPEGELLKSVGTTVNQNLRIIIGIYSLAYVPINRINMRND